MKKPDQVSAAAKSLDALRPGWAERINVDRLNMLSETSCVLGQLYGHINSAPFCGRAFRPFVPTTWSVRSERRLTALWEVEVVARLPQPVPVDEHAVDASVSTDDPIIEDWRAMWEEIFPIMDDDPYGIMTDV